MPAEIAVEDGAVERVFGFERQVQRRDEERADGGIAHDERLLRHDVETVAVIFVTALEGEQLGGDLRAVRGAAHEDHDLRRAETPVDQLADTFHDGRTFGKGLDRYVAGVFLAAPRRLLVVAVGVGQRIVQRCGFIRRQIAPFGRCGDLGVERPVVLRDDAVDRLVVECHDRRQAAPVLRSTSTCVSRLPRRAAPPRAAAASRRRASGRSTA